MASDRLTVGSLFAGIGGFDLAAEHAGMEVVFQVENDPAASALLEHHWPGLNRGDIHGCTFNPDNLGARHLLPAVDVLTGGFPCQDYSLAGGRAGLAGDRGALWWEFHRLIDEGRPLWVVAENVPGLLSSRSGRDLATIIDSLTDLGYGVVWGVLDSQYWGVPQRRRRLFIVGHSGGHPRPEILALAEGVYGHPEPGREEGPPPPSRPTRGAGGGGDGILADGGVTRIVSSTGGDLVGTLTTAFGPKNATNVQEVTNGSLVAFTTNQRNEVRTLDRAASLSANYGGKHQTFLGGEAVGVRRLTPLECERLQAFPDGWTGTPGNSDTARYRQLGNAVTVNVAEWILSRIAKAGT